MSEPDLDTCLRLVADPCRRSLLSRLRDAPRNQTSFENLVDRLAEDGAVPGGDRMTDRERLAIRLQHHHLPKLADHGLLEYDHTSGDVRYRPNEQIETVLDSLSDELSAVSP